jgi:hypothetical protein
MGERRNACGNLMEEDQLGKPRQKWEDNTGMDVEEIGRR